MKKMIRVLSAVFTLGVLCNSGIVTAQTFDAVIKVNDLAITQYELDQRARMLQLFRAPGDPQKLARDQLIEDRLKLDAARTNGLELEDTEIEEGMAEFAGRADLSTEQFIDTLKGAGVEESSFRDFVRAGLAWRNLTTARFGPRVNVTTDDIDRAKSAAGETSSVRVLLSELIMVAPPAEAQTVMARADQLSQIRSVDEFSAAARRYSAAATRAKGGRLEWMPLNDLPPQLRAVILNLSPGEVSEPLPLDGAVALFQLRDIEEMAVEKNPTSAIEYAVYYMAGGRSERTLKDAAQIKARIDVCDDLYGVAKDQPEEVLERVTKTPDEIPQDIRFELAKLDDGEVSTNLTTANGQTLQLIMLCGRVNTVAEDGPSDEELTGFIRSKRMQSLADGYLAQLRSEARIIEK